MDTKQETKKLNPAVVRVLLLLAALAALALAAGAPACIGCF
jgi:hypothetical protein